MMDHLTNVTGLLTSHHNCLQLELYCLSGFEVVQSLIAQAGNNRLMRDAKGPCRQDCTLLFRFFGRGLKCRLFFELFIAILC